MHEVIFKYFPNLSDEQQRQFIAMGALYSEWNSKINVISRKDFDNFYVNHVLHSLSIARVIQFTGSEAVLDLGTGGGFPGIPLAVIFPETRFVLLDSIAKKIKVVNEVAGSLQLKNVATVNARSEEHKGQYNFVVTRAVAGFPEIIRWTAKNINKKNPSNGIIALKGGDLTEEMAGLRGTITTWRLSDMFDEPFFETKKIIWLKF